MASAPNPDGRARFAKLGMALNEELAKSCRDVLEMEVPPGLVYNKVKSSSIYKNIRPEQELRLIGAKTNGYKELDITLLYTLIRNICTKIPRPTKGWGGNTMPSARELTIGDDIERIRMIRNNMFGHISSASTSQREFDDTWSIITDVCQRLQTYTKKDYMSGLSNIQSQALEEEFETNVIEKLKEDYKNNQSLVEKISSIEQDLLEMKSESENKVNPLTKEILDNWIEEDTAFIPTRASEAVQEKLKSLNIITVVGNSGSGKSAIIQHIALILKRQGWNVIPIRKVKEIKKICSTEVPENRILFVFNDPLGKESLDEILYHSWKNLGETLEICLKKNKLLISCRRCVFNDKRVKDNLLDGSTAVEIDSEEHGLTDKEKKAILNQYGQNLHLSEEYVTEIIKTEAYFPLLCKLFSREANYKEKGVDFFKTPYKSIKREIEIWKKTGKEQFCSLILIVAFENNLDIDAIVQNKMHLMKFKLILGMCKLQENTHISVIRNTLHELKGSYVKRVGNAFQFLHDFIMEITTLVFGVDCPQELIQYADSGFLRRRVRIEDDTKEEDRDPFTVYLPEKYIGDLVNRLITDMQTEHLVDVLLNPCLRKDSVIKSFKEKVKSYKILLEGIKCKIDRSQFQQSFKSSGFSRLVFLDWIHKQCPLVGLIVFCHNDITSFFLKSIPESKFMKLKEYPIFSALCANGDLNQMNYLSEKYKKTAMMEKSDFFLPIHIASLFHNFSIIEELIKLGSDVNMCPCIQGAKFFPLLLAAGNDEEHLKEAGIEAHQGERRNATISCLLKKGANINLCTDDGVSSLYIACENGHRSTVQLLLDNDAKINLCDKNGDSPLHRACQYGHDSTVQLLLNHGAGINLCNNHGISPLYQACENRKDSTVKLLLKNGAEINLCNEFGLSPLSVACIDRHDSTVQLLLENGANVNLRDKNKVSSLLLACGSGHDRTVQLLLNNGAKINLCDESGLSPLHIACTNGHDNMVQVLLNNGADINLCNNDGFSPLSVACIAGHHSIVQLLLNKGADIESRDNQGVSPLYIACQNGHDIIVQLLLNNGADINLCDNNGVSPILTACSNKQYSTVKKLLNNGADINLFDKAGLGPLYVVCHDGHDSTVQLLLHNGANINLCYKYGVSPLYLACLNGHDSTVQLLLNNGADINLCDNYRCSPLYKACENGHESTVQLLLNNGADINLSDRNRVSPLVIACKNGHKSTAQLLLRIYDEAVQRL